MTAFRSTLCALLLVAAAASALPAALLSEDGLPQDSPNRAAINVAMFGGVGRRSEAPRARRQVDGSDLGEVFSAESSYNTEGAPGRARRSVVSPVLAIESPFAPTMDVEDARRMRRANQAAGEGSGGREGGVGDVDYDHFPSKRAVDDYSDETYDDHDGVFYDDPVSKLGVRDRRQSKVDDANHDDGDDEAEEQNDGDDVEDVDCDMNGEPLPTRAPEPDVNDSSQRALADDSDEAAAQAVTPTKPTTEVADDCTTVTSFSVSTTSSDADAEEAPRLIREAPSEALIIKTLLEAPIDETILGELPVRRARRQVNAPQVTQVADGVPVNYIQPLSSGAALPAEPASEYSPGPGVLPTTGEKALQIYTVHRMASEPAAEPAIQPDSPAVADATSTSPLVIAAVPVLVPQTALGQGVLTPGFESRVEIVTPSPPTPSPASPATAMPVLASESAVDGVLPPGPTVHVNILPAPEAATLREPQAEVPQQPPVIADVVSLDNPAIMPSDAGQVPRPFRPSLPETVDSIVAMQGLTQDHQEDPGFLTFPPPRQQFQVGAPQYNGAKPAGFAPLVEKSIYVGPDGTYMYSYETADGVKVSETGALKEVPAQTEGTQAQTGTQAGTDPSSPSTRLANTVSGGYSYTAPDGTYFSLRYVADENGFRPVVGGGLGGLPSDHAAPFAGRGA